MDYGSLLKTAGSAKYLGGGLQSLDDDLLTVSDGGKAPIVQAAWRRVHAHGQGRRLSVLLILDGTGLPHHVVIRERHV